MPNFRADYLRAEAFPPTAHRSFSDQQIKLYNRSLTVFPETPYFPPKYQDLLLARDFFGVISPFHQ